MYEAALQANLEDNVQAYRRGSQTYDSDPDNPEKDEQNEFLRELEAKKKEIADMSTAKIREIEK